MVSPAWHNYRYHQNRLLSQENPKFNFWKIIWADRHFNLWMDFLGPGHPYRTLTDYFTKPLVISFETCIFTQVWFVAESGCQIAPNFVPILWISQPYPNRVNVSQFEFKLIFGKHAVCVL